MNLQGDKPGAYQLFMLALCIYVLLALGFTTLQKLDPATQEILDVADVGICAIFLVDFVHSLGTAANRRQYLLRWGWLDLASSVPMINSLRWARAARILRILRVLRGVRSARILAASILRRRAESAFLAVVLLTLLLVVFCSIAILQFEPEGGGNIATAEDALWWSVATVTTVGYGDKFPITTEGRILSAFLMISGVGLIGTFTGFVASWFLASGEKDTQNEIAEIRGQLDEIRRILSARDVDPSV